LTTNDEGWIDGRILNIGLDCSTFKFVEEQWKTEDEAFSVLIF